MKRTVRQVMTTDVVTAATTTPFKQLVRLIESNHVSALPVVDDRGVLVGIVSEADLLLKEEDPDPAPTGALTGRRRKLHRSKAVGLVASQVMTTPVVTIAPDAGLSEAARTMRRHGVKRLPVVDGMGRVLGIVSTADLLSVFLRSDEEIRRDVVNEVVDRSLWMEPSTIKVTVDDGVVTLRGRLERRSLVDAAVTLTRLVDGVVAVDSRLTFEVDDQALRPEIRVPWGVLPYGLRDRRD
jgi:CBS domain-containing protein